MPFSSSTIRTRSIAGGTLLQVERHLGADAGATVDSNPATMFLDDAIDDGQTQTRPVSERAVERLEVGRDLLLRHPDSRVREADHGLPVDPVHGLHRQNASLRHGLQGVLGEIPEDLLQAVGVRVDRDGRRIQLYDHLVIGPLLGAVLEQLQRLPDQGHRVVRLGIESSGLGEQQEVPDDRVQSLRFHDDDVHQLTGLRLWLEVTLEDLHGPADRRQRIAQLVCHACGHFSQRRHSLLERDLLLQDMDLGEVLKDEDHPQRHPGALFEGRDGAAHVERPS
jgi:hypothetical protein